MEESRILHRLRDLTLCYRRQRALEGAVRGAAWGGAAAVLLAVILKLTGARWPEVGMSAIPFALFPLAAFAVARLRPLSALQVALLVDERVGLKERLSTALDWMQAPGSQTLMVRALLKDAAQAVEPLQGPELFPFRMPRTVRSLAATLPLLAVLWALPAWSWLRHAPVAASPVVQHEAQRLEAVASRLGQARRAEAELPRTRQAQEEIRKLSRDLTASQVTRTEALARVSTLADRLRQDLDGQKVDPGYMDRLRRAGLMGTATPEHGAESPASRGSSRLQDMARKLQDGHPDAKTRAAMQQALEQMLRQLDPQDPLRRSLEKALQSLQQGDAREAAQALQQAASEMAATETQNSEASNLAQAVKDLESSKQTLAGDAVAQDGTGEPQESFQSGSEASGYLPLENGGATVKGHGKGGADYGKGTTQQYWKSGKTVARKDWILDRQKAGKEGRWTHEYRKLYAAERKDIAKANAPVHGEMQQGPTVSTQSSVRGAPTMAGGASTAEADVYLDSRRKAEESLSQENIPSEYRELVREYFDTIDPRADRNP